MFCSRNNLHIYIYIYLEPNWPLFLKVNRPKQGPFNQNNGHLGSRYIYTLQIWPFYLAVSRGFPRRFLTTGSSAVVNAAAAGSGSGGLPGVVGWEDLPPPFVSYKAG